jgi:alkaline phosphatase
MMLNGYASRGNDILDFASRPNTSLYETLTYATGPGYWYHMANDSKNHFIALENFSPEKRKEALYMHQSLIPMKDAVHGGEDVAVYSNSFLLQRVFEQSYIAYAISYAACIGPIDYLNPLCRENHVESSTTALKSHNILLLTLIFNLFSIFFVRKILFLLKQHSI